MTSGEQEEGVGNEVGAELEHDLGAKRQRDRCERAPNEPARHVGANSAVRRERGKVMGVEPLTPDAEEIAEAPATENEG